MKLSYDVRENWRTEKSESATWRLNIVEQVALGLAATAIIFGAIGYVSLYWGELSIRRFFEDFYVNASTELLSIALTILIIGYLLRTFMAEDKKQALILELGSSENIMAREAVRKLRHYGWLTDGTLQQTDLGSGDLQGAFLQFADLQETTLNNANLRRAMLVGANLQAAHLRGINLQQADLAAANLHRAELHGASLQKAALMGANLQAAILIEANLQGAMLLEANLQGADLGEASLRKAHLKHTNLRNVDLRLANLQDAVLTQTDLQGANLDEASLRDAHDINTAVFDTQTTLPNGERWRTGYDLAMFTDADHPKFWEPTWVIENRELLAFDTDDEFVDDLL